MVVSSDVSDDKRWKFENIQNPKKIKIMCGIVGYIGHREVLSN